MSLISFHQLLGEKGESTSLCDARIDLERGGLRGEALAYLNRTLLGHLVVPARVIDQQEVTWSPEL